MDIKINKLYVKHFIHLEILIVIFFSQLLYILINYSINLNHFQLLYVLILYL